MLLCLACPLHSVSTVHLQSYFRRERRREEGRGGEERRGGRKEEGREGGERKTEEKGREGKENKLWFKKRMCMGCLGGSVS